MRYYQKLTSGAYKICVKYQIDWCKGKCLFNLNNHQILHVGPRNIKNDYEMHRVKIKSVHLVKDLGVTVVSNLKLSQQCNESIKKNMIGLIKRFFSFKNKDRCCTTFV